MNTIKVTYRDIAKMLCRAMPIEDQDFSDKVNEYVEELKRMPKNAKVALRSAYIFSHKVPREEQEDLFQDLALAILKARTEDERLAYSIARCDWRDWWAKYQIRQHYSLDSVIDDGEGNETTFGELLVGEVDFERRINGDLDGQALYDKLPQGIQFLVDKRLIGKTLTKLERECLGRWASKNAMLLAT